MKYLSNWPTKHAKGWRGQRGFTAIELLVVIAVALGIYAIASGRFDMLFSGSRIAEENGNIVTLGSNIKSLRTTSGYGAANTNLTAQLVASNGIPKNISVTGTPAVMSNPFGGTIVPLSTGAGYRITSNAYTNEACLKLTTALSRSGVFTSIQINANAAIAGEVTSATATTQCNGGAANTVIYTSPN